MTDLAQTRGATWMEMGVVTMATMGVASGLGRPGYETIYDTCGTCSRNYSITYFDRKT